MPSASYVQNPPTSRGRASSCHVLVMVEVALVTVVEVTVEGLGTGPTSPSDGAPGTDGPKAELLLLKNLGNMWKNPGELMGKTKTSKNILEID